MDSFARNLRRECLRKGSIAQLCKATGINRQQFNKYMAGQILPGARTLRKICAHLGVSEAVLMSDAADSAVPAAGPLSVRPEIDCEPLPDRFVELPSDSDAGHTHVNSLRNGFYRAYFPVHHHPGLVASWLVQVAAGPGGGQIHSCRNHFDDGPQRGFLADHITYRGPVRYGPGEACLIGTARTPKPLHGIIFVDLRPVEGQDYLSAMVLTRRAYGPLALSGLMHFLGPACTGRAALATRGIVSLDDPAADPVMVRLMAAAPAVGPHWLQAVGQKLPRAELRSGGADCGGKIDFRRFSI